MFVRFLQTAVRKTVSYQKNDPEAAQNLYGVLKSFWDTYDAQNAKENADCLISSRCTNKTDIKHNF